VLTTFVKSYGVNYNPSKIALRLPQLNTLITTSQTCLAEMLAKNAVCNNVLNLCIEAFSDLKSLSTRLISAFEATDATPEKINYAKTFNRKIQGKIVSTAQTSTDPNGPAPITISQQFYGQLIQNFAGLISVLESESSYNPNEIDLKILTLKAKLADLISKNLTVSIAYASVSNAIIARDKILYNTNSGLVDIANEVKEHIKSIFGATSPEFAQVKDIEFRKSTMIQGLHLENPSLQKENFLLRKEISLLQKDLFK